MLEAEPGAALLRGRGLAPLAGGAGGVLHGVALVEDDHPVEAGAEPVHHLPDPRSPLLARVGAQRGVGGEQDALLQPDGRALPESREGLDQQPLLAERRPVAPRILDQRVGL